MGLKLTGNILLGNTPGVTALGQTLVQQQLVIKDVISDYTIVLSDSSNTLIRSISAFPVVMTLPAFSVVPIPIGAFILLGQSGTGAVSITGAPGVIVNSPGSALLTSQYAKVTALKVATDTWELSGSLQYWV